MNPLISPSLLAADFGHLASGIQEVEEAGADLLHVDVMDGHYVPNISIGTPVIKAIARHARKPLDMHLMVLDPPKFVAMLQGIPMHQIAVHLDAFVQKDPTGVAAWMQEQKQQGIRMGLAISPANTIASQESLLPIIDFVVVMMVEPGFGGQKFMPAMLEKVKMLHILKREKGLSFEIFVDGGISPDNARLCCQSGAQGLVIGNALFSGHFGTQKEVIAMLKRSCEKENGECRTPG